MPTMSRCAGRVCHVCPLWGVWGVCQVWGVCRGCRGWSWWSWWSVPVGIAALAAAFVGPTTGSAAAQEPPDTAAGDTVGVIGLERLVVTADRTAGALGSSVAAVTRLEGSELRAAPVAGLGEALALVPGIALVDFDGLGLDPQPIVRGFYGGGEVEYLLVLVDGRPVNDLQDGLVAWELVPPVAVERVEIVRGAASAVYGDAAIGGVVNVVTDPEASGARWEASAGGKETFRGGVRVDGRTGVDGGRWSAFGGALATDGFREHGERRSFAAGGSVDVGAPGGLTLSAATLRRENERPGPLDGDALAADRAGSAPFHRFDRRDEWVHRIGIDGRVALGAGATLSGTLGNELRSTEAVSTIPLSPGFADTKERRLDSNRLAGSVMLGWDGFVVGVDGSAGWLDSEYRALLSGEPEAYEAVPEEPSGELDAVGEVGRKAAALFAQYDARPWPALRLSVGVRLDWLSDDFEPRSPSEGERLEASHTAFSPRAGANLRWLRTARQTGHLYVQVGRSFKAPTPDQLFDQRSIPVPFPPFSVTLSNALLEPQTGIQLEVGAYHEAVLAPGGWALGGSLALYRMDMEDEIDFDLQTLSFVNLGQSRHDGVEAGVRLGGPSGAALFANYTLQAATTRQGEHTDNQLKAIPRHFFTAGASVEPAAGVEIGLYATRAGQAWLDDANTLELPAWTRVDARVGAGVGELELFIEARNLFDREYSTTGFPDPSGTDVVYHRPAAGRTFTVGLRGGG